LDTYHIRINGIVQGVGFRPFVYQTAKEMRLTGYVENGNGGVDVFFNGEAQEADLFYDCLKQSAPPEAVILSASKKKVDYQPFSDFSFRQESGVSEKSVPVTPDKALCNRCREELYDDKNRRFNYPFITCTQCGPRYSIIKKLPFDRHNTSMNDFTACGNCNSEYSNSRDKRFFSQTNSCQSCGVTLSLWGSASRCLTEVAAEALEKTDAFLKEGKIAAIKGVGGYLLVCDANRADVIARLRRLKNRPTKPLAVLFPDVERVSRDFYLKDEERALLQSAAAPVVLLYPKPNACNNLSLAAIAPGLNRAGVMIPSSPLLDLTAKRFNAPLIATSANISGAPIVYEDTEALNQLFNYADCVLKHTCEIAVPLDDSVAQFSQFANHFILLRRSRGYAPAYLNYKTKSTEIVLGAGAFLKSTFALKLSACAVVSQCFGSGESHEAQLSFVKTLGHCLSLYEITPDAIVADRHPDYFSHRHAKELAEKYAVNLHLVQHHEAHFAAVLAENNLLFSPEPILGVIWDGAGLGSDGHIWGGEFFRYENNVMSRGAHFDYFPTVAGDKTAWEPRLAALCAVDGLSTDMRLFERKFSTHELHNSLALIKFSSLRTSSAGRIFDAAAALLDLCDVQTYEGEAALYLQTLAESYVGRCGFAMDSSYFDKCSHAPSRPAKALMQGILDDLARGKPKNYIAAKFHFSLVRLIGLTATDMKVRNICFSGGVFQNALLTDWIRHEHAAKHQLFFHAALSPNDENISFGQVAFYENKIRSVHEKEENMKSMNSN